MSKLKIQYPPGATPLDPDESDGLIPDYLTNQKELNTLEQENILEGIAWATGLKKADLLSHRFSYELHKRMLGRVWKWAGKIRTTEKNIGVPPDQITIKLGQLFDDTKYWLKNNTYSLEEIAIRFHHRLVSIHAFTNGNGRHARLMTDLLLTKNGGEPFTWGKGANQTSIDVEGPTRTEYIAALHEADKKKFERLLNFARS